MNPGVDQYLEVGCGRCPLGGTPECKVHSWTEELNRLRLVLLDSELTEEVKWSVPTYTYQGTNVLILSAFKDFVSINLFKGVLLKDPHQVLEKPGPNSQSARYFKFTNLDQVIEKEHIIAEYIKEAIQIEKAGLTVEFKKNPEPIPEELGQRLENDPALNSAFYDLTPGRQRSYILHIGQAKQAKTRETRIDKCIPKIMEGKGFHEW